jgi:POT family proton-dependent oligopeptide transporter
MKSFVQSIYLFTNALGSALNEALIPVLVDPKILWMYAGISIFTACTAVVFWFLFHHYDAQEEKMYDLDRDLPTLVAPGQKTAQQIKEENL